MSAPTLPELADKKSVAHVENSMDHLKKVDTPNSQVV